MRQGYLRFLSISLATTVLLSICGCNNKTEKHGKVDIWSAYSTVKVLQNKKKNVYYDKLDAKLNISMMKNETEGAQLIISAGKDISEYDLKTSDLKDEKGNIISTENISVYNQKYLTVNSKTDIMNEDFVVGDSVPDMLLPLDIAKKFGENKIESGKNQGITVEVKTDSNTAAGTYKGSFTLKTDDDSYDIPVTVTVWDICCNDRRSFQSSFLIYSNTLLSGEYEVSDELIERYQKFFLDYKVNTYVIRNDDSTEKLVKEATTLFDNNNYNSICIPKIMTKDYTADSAEADGIIDYIKEIVRVSSAEKPYFKYLYIYPTYFDEVDYYLEKQEEFVNVFKTGGEWEKTLKRALSEVSRLSEYKSFDSSLKQSVNDALSKLPAVVPVTSYTEKWVDELNVTFCPYLSLFNEDSVSDRYKRQAALRTGGNLWVYTCSGPTNPYPTFHIDDYNLGTRLSGWMEKKNNINGYLYWSVDLYECANTETWKEVDPYTTAERSADTAGDGFLCYPGAYYGSDYPFPCIRLNAYRDSMDDYDMLSLYEQLLKEKSASYGINVDFDSCVKDLYNELFNGTVYYTDDSVLFNTREKLAQRIMALESESGIFAVPSQNYTTVYSAGDTVNVDKNSVKGTPCGSGYSFKIENAKNKTYSISVKSGKAAAEYPMVYYKNLSASDLVSNSASKIIATDNGFTAVVKSEKKENEGAAARFRPFVQFGIKDLKGISSINFTFKNETKTDIEGYVYIVSEDMTSKQIGTFLADDTVNNVSITLNKQNFTDDVLSKARTVKISFSNSDATGALLPDKSFTVENIYVGMR